MDDGPDPRAALAAVGVHDPESTERVLSGWGGVAVWRVEHGRHVSALRVFAPAAGEAAGREVAAMRAASGGGVPAPEVRAVGEAAGRPVVLIGWCPGRTLGAELGRRPWRAWGFGRSVGRMQAALHAIPAPPEVRSRPWIAWAGLPEGQLRERLEELGAGRDALLHLDLHPENVLVQDGAISCLLDWENVRAGDPRADVARSRSILWLARRQPGRRMGTGAVVAALAAGWRRGYGEVAGPVGDLAPFEAWAAAVMVRDLEPKLAAGRAGVWIREEDLAALRRRAASTE